MTQNETNLYLSEPYRRAQRCHIILAALTYMIDLTATDAFLSKLLMRLGMGEAMIGVTTSLITFSFLIQLLSIPLLRLRISYKKTSMSFELLGLFSFVLVFLLPVSGTGKQIARMIAVALLLFANVSRNLVSGIQQRWTNDFVDPRLRGAYSARKECVSLVVGILYTLLIGYLFDRLEAAGQADTAFTTFAAIIFLCTLCSFVSMLRIPKERFATSSSHTMKQVLEKTVGNRRFRPVLVLTILWESGRYFTIGFLGTFKTENLALSMLAIQVINTVSSLARLAVTRPFGRYSDNHSFAGGIELGLYFAAAAFLCCVFTTPKLWFLIVAYSVLSAIGMAGLNQNLFNISYSYMDGEFLTEAMALRSSLGGLCGFLASAVAGLLFDVIAKHGLFGWHIAPQQLLSFVSFIFMLATLLYTSKVIRPMPVSVQ